MKVGFTLLKKVYYYQSIDFTYLILTLEVHTKKFDSVTKYLRCLTDFNIFVIFLFLLNTVNKYIYIFYSVPCQVFSHHSFLKKGKKCPFRSINK